MAHFTTCPAPIETLWGTPQTRDQILPGIWHITTASHGGFVLSDKRNTAMPEALRLTGNSYEEDVDWALVMFGFAEEFRRLATPGAALRVENARASVRVWHPDRFTAYTGEDVPANESHILRRRAAYQAVIGDYATTAAFGDWAAWVPTGKVGVVGRRVESVDACGFARYSGTPIYGLVEKARYAARGDVETFTSLAAIRVESDAPITKQI